MTQIDTETLRGLVERLSREQEDGQCNDSLCYEAADPIEALRAKLAATAWQPIDTAPRDGTPILTWSDGCTENEACMVMWWTAEKADRCGFGWEAYEVSHMLAPEFWMPLPAPPTDAARGKIGDPA